MIHKGRNWVNTGMGFDTRYDGWWIGDYWAWSPKFVLLPVAIIYRLVDGGNNFFFTPERRGRLPFHDNWIFSRQDQET